MYPVWPDTEYSDEYPVIFLTYAVTKCFFAKHTGTTEHSTQKSYLFSIIKKMPTDTELVFPSNRKFLTFFKNIQLHEWPDIRTPPPPLSPHLFRPPGQRPRRIKET